MDDWAEAWSRMVREYEDVYGVGGVAPPCALCGQSILVGEERAGKLLHAYCWATVEPHGRVS